jgi:hypothetical protein
MRKDVLSMQVLVCKKLFQVVYLRNNVTIISKKK